MDGLSRMTRFTGTINILDVFGFVIYVRFYGLSDPDLWLNCVLALKIQLVEETTENSCERYVPMAAITGKIILPSLLG